MSWNDDSFIRNYGYNNRQRSDQTTDKSKQRNDYQQTNPIL